MRAGLVGLMDESLCGTSKGTEVTGCCQRQSGKRSDPPVMTIGPESLSLFGGGGGQGLHSPVSRRATNGRLTTGTDYGNPTF